MKNYVKKGLEKTIEYDSVHLKFKTKNSVTICMDT